MIGFKVDSTKVHKALDQLKVDIRAAVIASLNEGVEIAKSVGLAEVQRQTRRRTGRLERSFSAALLSDTTARLRNDAPYATYVDTGTSAHVIKPRKARMLSWMNGAQRVFANSVNHPGTAARPFVQPAAAFGERVIAKRLQDRVNALARAFAGESAGQAIAA